MSNPTFYLVLVRHDPKQQKAIQAFEQAVAPIMARHGGKMQAILRPKAPGTNLGQEVHFLRFDQADGLSHYKADPELQTLAGLAKEAFQSLEVIPCESLDLGEYYS